MGDFSLVFVVLIWALTSFVNMGIASAFVDRHAPLVHHNDPSMWFDTQMYILGISLLGPMTLLWILIFAKFGKYGFKFNRSEGDSNSIWFHRLRHALKDQQDQERVRMYSQPRYYTLPSGMLREILSRNGEKIREIVARAEGNIISIWE